MEGINLFLTSFSFFHCLFQTTEKSILCQSEILIIKINVLWLHDVYRG